MSEATSSRADQTREQLMRAAERLFARDGIENVPVRAIIREAGQRNESALHYHFASKAGLIEALQDQRVQQVVDSRESYIDAATANGRKPDIREICVLMVKPPFQLCARSRGFRDFIGVFGQRVALSGDSATAHLEARRTSRFAQIESLLREQLSHLDGPLFRMRLDNMSRFATLAMSRRARDKGSFRGKAAELFVNDLADTMAGMLMAAVWEDTRASMEDH